MLMRKKDLSKVSIFVDGNSLDIPLKSSQGSLANTWRAIVVLNKIIRTCGLFCSPLGEMFLFPLTVVSWLWVSFCPCLKLVLSHFLVCVIFLNTILSDLISCEAAYIYKGYLVLRGYD